MHPVAVLHATHSTRMHAATQHPRGHCLAAVLLPCILLPFWAPGCASITGSRNQPVSVTCSIDGKAVSGASCQLINDKGQWFVTTPGTVMIQKAYGDLAISCRKEAYAGTAAFKSSSEAGVWGNILAGGLIGYAIDASSGAGFSYPQTMNISLLGPGSVLPDPPATPGRGNPPAADSRSQAPSGRP